MELGLCLPRPLQPHAQATVRHRPQRQPPPRSDQFEQIQRIEAASANSIDGFAFFATSVLFALVTGVPKQSLIGACTTYTIARIVYGAVYVFISHDVYSQLRGISFWVGNASCLYLLWKGGRGGY
ncbi:hypothetical protein, variant [Exophiala sideris]|uniref:MAPEG family protein n=1 Tax=Exophiala sideris TaxID=1016849 RepID=A0A0D1YRU7_9EURO|nr:hypothetical protein, variant [Exophiala sideris]